MKIESQASARENARLAGLKLPPHNQLAEQTVIGAVLTDADCWHDLDLSSADFYLIQHRLVWEAFTKLAAAGQPMDAVTVSESLEASGSLEQAGGLEYLGQLAADSIGSANLQTWGEVVRHKSILRAAISGVSKVLESAYAGDFDQCLSEIESLANGTARPAGNAEPVHVADIAPRVIEEMQAQADAGGALQGVATGLADLDQMISGLCPADLVILAGRPAMGKTSLALQAAEHLAETVGPVAVFSLEMPAAQLVRRRIASGARVPGQKIRAPAGLSPDEWSRIGRAAGNLASRQLYIVDGAGLRPRDIRATSMRLHRKAPLAAVVVDYLQLMSGDGDNRTEEIAHVSRSLKALAKELDCPVLALSQLNRSCEARDNKRPRLSDLRESGGIEQDADVVAFIYRDEVYNPDSPSQGIAEIIIGKQRNGPVGTVHAAFLADTTEFANLAHDYEPPPEPEPRRRKWGGKRGFHGDVPPDFTGD